MSVQTVLEHMWQDYLLLNPEAQRVVDTLLAEGESIVNDHIALRTFDVGVVALDECAKPFLAMGYEEKDEYCLRLKVTLNTMNTRRTRARRKSLSVSYWSMSSRATFKTLLTRWSLISLPIKSNKPISFTRAVPGM